MNVDHSAAGPALGYIYQFDRATYRLFQAEVDVIEVGIEDVDDVSVHKINGEQIHEQDKSSVNQGSSLSDRSVSLWKTLHIWAELILIDPINLNNIEFNLVTNGALSDNCLAKRINNVLDEESSIKLCDELRIIIPTLREDLKPFGFTLNQLSDQLLGKLIQKVYVFDNMCSKFGGDLKDIQVFRVFDNQIRENLFDQMAGWVKRRIRELVQNGKRPRIKRDDFDKELKGLVRKVTVARLSALVVPFNSNVNISEYESHGFVKQLDWINVDEDTIREAILDYIHAQDTRIDWTDKNVISESALILYERDLRKSWATARKRASRQLLETDELTGQECLDLTMEHNSFIHNEVMPKTITCGNFHALAHYNELKEPEIGWHPNFKFLLKGI